MERLESPTPDPEKMAAYDKWVDDEFKKGVCPFSGLEVHRCHKELCDCFDSWACNECGDDIR